MYILILYILPLPNTQRSTIYLISILHTSAQYIRHRTASISCPDHRAWPLFCSGEYLDSVIRKECCLLTFCSGNCWIPCVRLVISDHAFCIRCYHKFPAAVSRRTTLMMHLPFFRTSFFCIQSLHLLEIFPIAHTIFHQILHRRKYPLCFLHSSHDYFRHRCKIYHSTAIP